MEMVAIRREMDSEIIFTDGRTERMAPYLPRLTVQYTELEPFASVKEWMRPVIDTLSKKLLSFVPGRNREILRGGHAIPKSSVMINGSVLRRISLVSTDVNNVALTEVGI
jgi:hypothetical protein